MKPVHLSFAREGRLAAWLYGHVSSLRWRRLQATLLLAIAFMALCGAAWFTWLTWQHVREAQDAIQMLEQRQGHSVRLAAADAAKPLLSEQQRRDWNLLVGQLNTPWSAILDALEASLPDTIALVSIEPDSKHGGVHLQVEAKTLDTLLSYAMSLKTIGLFSDVALIKHETNEQDPTHPLRLSLAARLEPRPGVATPVRERAR